MARMREDGRGPETMFSCDVAASFFLAPFAGTALLLFASGPSLAGIAAVLVGVGLGPEVI